MRKSLTILFAAIVAMVFNLNPAYGQAPTPGGLPDVDPCPEKTAEIGKLKLNQCPPPAAVTPQPEKVATEKKPASVPWKIVCGEGTTGVLTNNTCTCSDVAHTAKSVSHDFVKHVRTERCFTYKVWFLEELEWLQKNRPGLDELLKLKIRDRLNKYNLLFKQYNLTQSMQGHSIAMLQWEMERLRDEVAALADLKKVPPKVDEVITKSAQVWLGGHLTLGSSDGFIIGGGATLGLTQRFATHFGAIAILRPGVYSQESVGTVPSVRGTLGVTFPIDKEGNFAPYVGFGVWQLFKLDHDGIDIPGYGVGGMLGVEIGAKLQIPDTSLAFVPNILLGGGHRNGVEVDSAGNRTVFDRAGFQALFTLDVVLAPSVKLLNFEEKPQPARTPPPEWQQPQDDPELAPIPAPGNTDKPLFAPNG